MITIYVDVSHMKVFFNKATTQEILKTEQICKTKFRARDTGMAHNPMVKRGFISDIRSFYSEEHNILPTGFIRPLCAYLDQMNVEYEVVDKRKFPGVNKNVIEQIIDGEFEINNYMPRPDQIDAIKACLKYKHGVVQAPTGFGKTFCIYLLTQVFSKPKILLLFSSVDILMQTYDKFTQDYRMDKNEIGIIQGGNYKEGRVILLSVQSYAKAFHIFPEIKIAICDEVHETGRNETSEKILYSLQNCAIKYGFSATPETDNPFETMRIFANVGPIIFERTLSDQIDIGTLANTEVEVYKYPIERHINIVGSWGDVYENIKVDKSHPEDKLVDAGYEIVLKEGKKYGRKFIKDGDETNHFVNNNTRNKKIVDIIRKYSSIGKRVMCIFSRVEHGKILYDLLNDDSAMLISGEDKIKTRKAAKNHLIENKGAIVFASGIWKAGVDIPPIDVFINAAGGKGLVIIQQKAGRVVRTFEGKDKAIIVDLDDSELSPIGKKQFNKRVHIYKDKLGLKVIQK